MSTTNLLGLLISGVAAITIGFTGNATTILGSLFLVLGYHLFMEDEEKEDRNDKEVTFIPINKN